MVFLLYNDVIFVFIVLCWSSLRAAIFNKSVCVSSFRVKRSRSRLVQCAGKCTFWNRQHDNLNTTGRILPRFQCWCTLEEGWMHQVLGSKGHGGSHLSELLWRADAYTLITLMLVSVLTISITITVETSALQVSGWFSEFRNNSRYAQQ